MTTAYVPLGQREEWKDVTPIPQDDGANPLVPIMYTEDYRNAMDYFRAVSASGEHSERVLALTEAIIRKNPAHYTVWQYRFNTLVALQKDSQAELELMNEFARENLKSYQVWHHRLSLSTQSSPEDPTPEIEFIHAALSPDPKNYHTWAYSHWSYCHFSALGRITPEMWDKESAWCEGMSKEDARNNSAWGWRWFLRMAPRPQPSASAPAQSDRIEEESSYASSQIHEIPHNASAWNYLRGVSRSTPQGSDLRASILPVLAPYLAGSAVAASGPDDGLSAWPQRTGEVDGDTPTPVPLALECQAEAMKEEGRSGDAAAIYGQLAAYADRMRSAYWEMKREGCVNA